MLSYIVILPAARCRQNDNPNPLPQLTETEIPRPMDAAGEEGSYNDPKEVIIPNNQSGAAMSMHSMAAGT